MSRNQKIILAIIILLAAFLIFFRLGRQQVYNGVLEAFYIYESAALDL